MIGDVTAAACAERADLAVLLRSLTPRQWRAPTLCGDWTVRDVVAHLLSYEELGVPALLARFVRGGLRLSGANAAGVAESAQYSPEQLLDLLGRHLRPRGLTTGFGDRIGLLDAMIHQQDIRRPLGIARDIPAERLLPALRFARTAPPIGTPWRIRGVRLIATDLGWAAGRGREVRGRGEALLMAMAGRRGVCAELDGAGVPILRARIGG